MSIEMMGKAVSETCWKSFGSINLVGASRQRRHFTKPRQFSTLTPLITISELMLQGRTSSKRPPQWLFASALKARKRFKASFLYSVSSIPVLTRRKWVKAVAHRKTRVWITGCWPVITELLNSRVTETRKKVGRVPVMVMAGMVMASRGSRPCSLRFLFLNWKADIASAMTWASASVLMLRVLSSTSTRRMEVERRIRHTSVWATRLVSPQMVRGMMKRVDTVVPRSLKPRASRSRQQSHRWNSLGWLWRRDRGSQGIE